MLVALICEDRPDGLELRLSTRDSHRAYLAQSDAVVQAGPLLDGAGRMCGSLIVLDVPDLTAAEAFAADDPYAQAGLFARTLLRGWNRTIG